MIQNSFIEVRNTEFQNNIAGYGGAIRYTEAIPTFLQKIKPQDLRSNKDSQGNWIIGENKFKNNIGYIFGNEIGGVFININIEVQSSNFDFIKLNNDIDIDKERKVNIDDSTENQYKFSKFRSGEKDFQFQIEFFDLLNQKMNSNFTNNLPDGFILSEQIIQEIEDIRCKIIEIQKSLKVEEQQISIDGQTDFFVQQSKDFSFYGITLNNIQVIGVPGQKESFCLEFDGLFRLRQNFTFIQRECIKFLVEFRECQRGEIYHSRCDNCIMKYCDICTDGFYSLVEPTPTSNEICKPFQYQYSSKCESDQITLLPGYQRENQYSDVIIECEKKYASCNGNLTSYYCVEGFIGPLCETCDYNGQFWSERYVQSTLQGLSCIKCSNVANQQIFLIFSLLVSGGYLFFQIFNMNQNGINQIKNSVIRQLGVIMPSNSLVKQELFYQLFYSIIKVNFINIHRLKQKFKINFYLKFKYQIKIEIYLKTTQYLMKIIINMFYFNILIKALVILRLVESYLTVNMHKLCKNNQVVSVLNKLSKILKENIFFKKNGMLRRHFPTLYLILHQRHLIVVERNFYRWKLVKIHVQDFVKERKKSHNADFYQIAKIKQSVIINEIKISQSNQYDSWSKQLLQKKATFKDSVIEQSVTNCHSSQLKQVLKKNASAPFSPHSQRDTLIQNSNELLSFNLDKQNQQTPDVFSMIEKSKQNNEDEYLSNFRLHSPRTTDDVEKNEKLVYLQSIFSDERIPETHDGYEKQQMSQSLKTQDIQEKEEEENVNQNNSLYFQSINRQNNK